MARNERTRKVRRVRRGGGVRNFFTRLFTRRGPPAQTPDTQPTTSSRWKFPNIRKLFSRRRVEPVAQAVSVKMPTRNVGDFTEETFPNAFQRVFWYVKQRYEGKTHEELVPFLDIPGSFTVSTQEYNDFKDIIFQELQKHGNNIHTTAEALKASHFGQNFDNELNNWESAKRLTEEENNLKCFKAGLYGSTTYCILYPGTNVEVLPFDNVANGLQRFIGVLLEHESMPNVIKYKTNYAMGCSNRNDNFKIFTTMTMRLVDTIKEDEIWFGTLRDGSPIFQDYVVLANKYFKRRSSEVPSYPPGGCYENILAMYSITEAVINNEIYLMHPRFGYKFSTMYPDLYEKTFGTASGWKMMSPLEKMRMFLLCWYAGRYLFTTGADGPTVRQMYTSYPEPALSTVKSILKNSTFKNVFNFNHWFEKYQELVQSDSPSEKVIPLYTYLSMLSKKEKSFATAREELFSKPIPSLSLPENVYPSPINLSAAVPYDPATELTNINRVNYLTRKFRNPLMNVEQKAYAKTLLNIARVQKQGNNIFMTEKEHTNLERAFTPKPRPNWTRRVGRGRRA